MCFLLKKWFWQKIQVNGKYRNKHTYGSRLWKFIFSNKMTQFIGHYSNQKQTVYLFIECETIRLCVQWCLLRPMLYNILKMETMNMRKKEFSLTSYCFSLKFSQTCFHFPARKQFWNCPWSINCLLYTTQLFIFKLIFWPNSVSQLFLE